MICKDDDVCSSCFRRRKKTCRYEPFGWGPDQDGEYGVGCDGLVAVTSITDSRLNDVLGDYHGIGDPIPWNIYYPAMIWHGLNWLRHYEEYPMEVAP